MLQLKSITLLFYALCNSKKLVPCVIEPRTTFPSEEGIVWATAGVDGLLNEIEHWGNMSVSN